MLGIDIGYWNLMCINERFRSSFRVQGLNRVSEENVALSLTLGHQRVSLPLRFGRR